MPFKTLNNLVILAIKKSGMKSLVMIEEVYSIQIAMKDISTTGHSAKDSLPTRGTYIIFASKIKKNTRRK
jgi:hypothetical protein